MDREINVLQMIVAVVLLLAPGKAYCQAENMGRVTMFGSTDTDKVVVELVTVFNGQPLKLSDRYYVNEHGDTLYIDAFRFYMTNINFNGSARTTGSNSHLYDEEDSNTRSFVIKGVAPGTYYALQFILGVDSATNTSGANDGDLDPAKGMYWAWNSGYIMARLQGHSAVCKTLHHAFEFHIGGYMPPYNAARLITLKLPSPVVVGKQGIPFISLNVDVAKWFSGNLDLAKVNDIVTPGKEASLMADRYAQMFSVRSVEILGSGQ